MSEQYRQPLAEEIIDARDIIAENDFYFGWEDDCPVSADGEHEWRLISVADDYEIYECEECGLIDC